MRHISEETAERIIRAYLKQNPDEVIDVIAAYHRLATDSLMSVEDAHCRATEQVCFVKEPGRVIFKRLRDQIGWFEVTIILIPEVPAASIRLKAGTTGADDMVRLTPNRSTKTKRREAITACRAFRLKAESRRARGG